jgi:RadC-like JAB domain
VDRLRPREWAAAGYADGLRYLSSTGRAIVQIATPLGISVHDHIIVGKNGHASLKGMRLI